MGLFKEFREFAMRGSVMDLAIGVIIGAAFGRIVNSLVEDVLMPPIGKAVGNLDFSNLYISLSDKIDAANAHKAAEIAATQPATQASMIGSVTSFMDTATRLPLADARKIGPVIAYGNFITITINFLIVAMCVFLLVKLLNTAQKRWNREKAAEPPPPAPPTKEEVLLGEIRDILKQQRAPA